MHHTDNDDHLLVVRVIPVQNPIQVGTWTLEVLGVSMGSGRGNVDGWVERNDDRPVVFTVGNHDDMTLSIPGTADTVISVSASNTSNPASLTINSSFGPTRKNGPKPDVNAPGDQIAAARSNSVDHQEVITLSGTSMAAPHVTGAMVLALSSAPQKMPGRSHEEAVQRDQPRGDGQA